MYCARVTPALGICLLAILFCPIHPAMCYADSGKRPLQPQDLNLLEGLSEVVSVSPDGHSFAFVRYRPHVAGFSTNAHSWREERGDVWVYDGKLATSITNHDATDMSFGSPAWSPNGDALAMTATRGKDTGVAIWDRGKNDVRITWASELQPNSLIWLDDERLIVKCGTFAGISPLAQSSDIASSEWTIARDGHESTASVLESPPRRSKSTIETLVLIDRGKGVIAKIDADGIVWDFETWGLDREHGRLAFWRQMSSGGSAINQAAPKFELLAIDEMGQLIGPFRGVGVSDSSPSPSSSYWSSDGRYLSVLELRRGGTAASWWKAAWLRCTVASGQCIEKTHGVIDGQVDRVIWDSEGRPFFRSGRRSIGNLAVQTPETGWWTFSQDGRVLNLFQELSVVPEHLYIRQDEIIGVAYTRILRINPTTFKSEVVFKVPSDAQAGMRISAFDFDQTGSGAVVSIRHGKDLNGQDHEYLVDLSNRSSREIRMPIRQAKLWAYLPMTHSVVVKAEDRTGTHVWKCSESSKECTIVLETNTFLSEVEEGQVRTIEYSSMSGGALTAVLILPPTYRAGTKYPTIVWVYPGTVFDRDVPTLSINDTNTLNPQLFAAHGYLVLLPSMPRPGISQSGSSSDDPYSDLLNGVMPAVDKAIDMGLADPNRLAVAGHSFGGFGVYGLITQTNRFKAAISISGPADLLSMYGTFDGETRYGSELPDTTSFLVSGQFGMGDRAPWGNVCKYLRNSPIFYIDRVETPLMIVQGDMDYVPIQQGEEFFTALARQGKRAEFVRYWGEGHVLGANAANTTDIWKRIYSWLDEFVKNPGVE